MPDNAFYTDRIDQVAPRTSEEISRPAWRGIVVLIQQRLDDGSLARAFPEYCCSDDRGRNTITGTDRKNFLNALEANVPQLTESAAEPDDGWGGPFTRTPLDPDNTPDTAIALDVIDFVALHIEQPSSSYPIAGTATTLTTASAKTSTTLSPTASSRPGWRGSRTRSSSSSDATGSRSRWATTCASAGSGRPKPVL
jgi:hypothetical protein